ncbi:helix-hairpin-helix domain-containing protein [Variovorax guangxiensis]|uniref:Helix-hairpin-helix domain-containing protein n=1 Tax=Variovorax guangxiensis TaxID=1775474 RepID=A0A433MTF7_9BURK|nr:helix-hairpin-helix domain-containing protein [Variovorax guangxiensis]RUR71072.1 helix-hairpin-helix domain-containing protein [Variovorax guangxiensis]
MNNLWTGGGASVALGKQLGKGGEGSVFDVPAQPKLVAKLYHSAPNPQKQDKLRFMVANGHKDLLAYSAWPVETLHQSRGGPVVGFLMERVSQKQPVHMLYSPAHRKQDYPKAAWDFLLYAARNTATAFEAVHRHGHVLGDVNQGNVMVGSDSKVLLIDSDSMQIAAGGKVHLCEVGVSHFTPPELQGTSSFSTLARNANHDAFGLALLVFHLLFGGRHPFAGRPLRDDVGNGLEPDIKAFRFAYGSDARQRGFAPPPRSIPLTLVPPSVQSMFHRAFTEAGAAPAGRPTASQWVAALDQMRNTLKTCGKSKMHIYPNHSSACPWCALEDQGTHFFIDLGTFIAHTGSGFVLAKVWAAIESIHPPKAPALTQPSQIKAEPTPLPTGLKKGKSRTTSFVAMAVVAALFTYIAPALGILGGLLCLGIWLTISSGESEDYKKEMAQRRSRQDTAQKAYDQLVSNVTQITAGARFTQEKQGLATLRQAYENLASAEKNMIESAKAKAQARQLHDHLDRFFIEDANISGLGPAKKAALRSWGIETAADVNQSSVEAVKGFGPKLTMAMLGWRSLCEARFRFDPSPQALQADIARAKNEIAAQRQKLESGLQGGLERLARMRVEAEANLARATPILTQAASTLAQATADLAL